MFLVLLVSLVWRLPSLADPPWVNDEGTYFAVAQAMAHGYRLYRDVWENKPPALYLLYSAVYHLVGPSLLTVRLIATMAVLITVVLTYAVSRLSLDVRASLLSSMLVGLLMGVPFIEGTTANAEVFVALGSVGAVYVCLCLRRPVLAGSLMTAALLFKSVAAFDMAALGLWLLAHRRHDLGWYTLGVAVTLSCALLITWWTGIFPAMVRDAVAYDLGYVGHGNGAGIPWLLLMKVTLLAVLTVLLRRSSFPSLWLVYAIAGSSISGRFFGHYAIQFLVPLSIVVAGFAARNRGIARRTVIVLPLLFLSVALTCAVVGAVAAAMGHDSILSRRLGWYVNYVRYVAGGESSVAYRNGVDDHVDRNIRVAQVVAHGPPGRMLVWGNAPWIYVLSRRLPATPYTSALRVPEVPGETDRLRLAVSRGEAAQIVLITPATPPLGRASRSLALHYRVVRSISNATVYVSK